MKIALIIFVVLIFIIYVVSKIFHNIYKYKRNMPLEKNVFGRFVKKLMDSNNKML